MGTAGLSLVGLLLQGRCAPLLLRGRAGLCLLALLATLVNHAELAAAVGRRSLHFLARLALALALAPTARDAKPGRRHSQSISLTLGVAAAGG